MGLVRVGEEIERLDPSEIRWNEVMLVDPRDYEPSEWNARQEDPDRHLKSLEDSILNSGFRHPIIVDENKKIIDGKRRWLVAMKHGLKIPAIHRRYGSGPEADFKRAVDSIVANMGVSNTAKELGMIINRLKELGFSSQMIASCLGKTISQINDWSGAVEAPRDLVPPEDKEGQEIYAGMTKRQKRIFRKLVEQKNLPIEERAQLMREFVKLSPKELKEIEESLEEDLPVKVEPRKSSIKTTRIEARVPTHQYQSWKRKLKARGWDKSRTIMTLFNMWTSGIIEISQDEYENFGRDDYGLEEDS